jgi:hypothetical protein
MAVFVRDPVASAREERRRQRIGVGVARSPLGAGRDKAEAESLVSMMTEMYHERSGKLFGGLLAAGRAADAEKYANELALPPAQGAENAAEETKANGELRVALVMGAIQIGQGVRENAAMLRAMLDEAAKEGADVAKARAALDETLQKPAQPAPKAAPAKE